jgi:hypothetical protein
MITKSAQVSTHAEITDEELAKINQYTLKVLTKDDVYVVKLVAGNSSKRDRNFEPFTDKAIADMAKLYPGKTVIKNHNHDTDNQVGRVFDAYVEDVTVDGKTVKQLMLKIYMLKDANPELIRDIEAGIKKEVSTSCSPEHVYCNVCGVDNMKEYCRHWPGATYTIKGEEKVCSMDIDGVKDVYEVSFVAVPSQPDAGATKSKAYAPGLEMPEKESAETPDKTFDESEKTLNLSIDLEGIEAFLELEKG